MGKADQPGTWSSNRPETEPRFTRSKLNGFTIIQMRKWSCKRFGLASFGIAAIPNEVYGITGLKIKKQSPFASTFSFELANGSRRLHSSSRTASTRWLHHLAGSHSRFG